MTPSRRAGTGPGLQPRRNSAKEAHTGHVIKHTQGDVGNTTLGKREACDVLYSFSNSFLSTLVLSPCRVNVRGSLSFSTKTVLLGF